MSNEVDWYILSYPEEIQDRLQTIRQILKEILCEAEEKISYGMPTYKAEKNLIHFAAFKNHIGIFPSPAGVEAFKDEIRAGGYKYSKGGFQIDHKRELPLNLIRKLALWCKERV
ncbi:iron chaperone [Peptoniphilaceae bacterium SGI.131]